MKKEKSQFRDWMFVILMAVQAMISSQLTAQEKGLILFDVSHGVWSDRYHGKFTIEDGYAILANSLREEGFRVGEIEKGPISTNTIVDAKALVLSCLKEPLISSEVSAIEEFVKKGGGLLILGDSNAVLESEDYMRLNNLAALFDIQFDKDTICDIDESVPGSAKVYIHNFIEHEITVATGSIQYVWGCSLTVGTTAKTIAFSDETSWCDENLNQKPDKWEKHGSFPVVAVAEQGKGRVVCIGERRFLTSVHIGNPKASRVAGFGRSFDTWSFGIKMFYWLTKNKQDVVIVRQGKIVALVPNCVYRKQKERLEFAFRILNDADAPLSLLYNKSFATIPLEVFPIFSQPDDPQMWGAMASRNKIILAAWYLDRTNVNDEDYAWSLLHEYTHSFNDYHYAYRMPVWLDEGLAGAIPLMILPEIGLSEYADTEGKALDKGAAGYIKKGYSSAIRWNHSSFEERGAAYGFTCFIVKDMIARYGWSTFLAFFRLLELQEYPLGQPTNPETYELDPIRHTERAIQRLCILTQDKNMLAKFIEWKFPITTQVQESILRSINGQPSLRLTKTIFSYAKAENEAEIRLQLENLEAGDIGPVEVIDPVPLGATITQGKTSWNCVLKPGKPLDIFYTIKRKQAEDYRFPSAIVLYRISGQTFSAVRSAP